MFKNFESYATYSYFLTVYSLFRFLLYFCGMMSSVEVHNHKNRKGGQEYVAVAIVILRE